VEGTGAHECPARSGKQQLGAMHGAAKLNCHTLTLSPEHSSTSLPRPCPRRTPPLHFTRQKFENAGACWHKIVGVQTTNFPFKFGLRRESLAVAVGTVQSHKVELELCAPASPPAGPPGRVLLPNTYTQDGWFLQPKRRPGQLGFLAGSPSAAERLCIVVPCSTYITSE
jgi:hypothetical protein